MKLFGEYLIELGIISEEALVDALVAQSASLPSVLEVVAKKNLLSAKDILQITRLQTEKNISFQQSCEELKLWTNELSTNIIQNLNAERTPIGQILVKNKAAEFEAITHALDEYLAKMGDEKEKQTADSPPAQETVIEENKPITPSVTETGTDTTASQSDSDFSPDLKEIDAGLVSDFGDLLSEPMLNELQNQIGSLDPSHEGDKKTQIMKEVFDGFHKIKGSARFINAPVTEHVCDHVENCINAILPTIGESSFDLSALKNQLETAFSFVGSLRQCLLDSHTEKSYWESSNSQMQSVFNELGKIAGSCPGSTTKQEAA